MVYLYESQLSSIKLLPFALSTIYGINKATGVFICKKLGFSRHLKINDLSKEHLNNIVKSIESLHKTVGGDLLKTRLLLAKKLVNIKSYRGLRRLQGLPIRGQRTHTNAKTSRKKFK